MRDVSERPGAAVFLPAILALLLRVAFLALCGPLPADHLAPDEKEYLALAHAPFGGPGVEPLLPTRPPLYPLFLRATGESASSLLAQASLGAIAVALVAWTARRGGRRAAWLAGLLLAFDPISNLYTLFYTSEILFALLLALALALWLRRVHPAVSGLVFGLLPVCRPIGLLAGPLFTPRGLRPALLFIGAWALPVITWGLWIGIHTGEPPLAHLAARNLVLFRAAPVLAEAEGMSVDSARARLGWKTPEGPSVRAALGVLEEHPQLALRQAGVGLAAILFGPGWESLQSRMVSPTQTVGRPSLEASVESTADRGPRAYQLVGILWCALGYLLAGIGLLRAALAPRKPPDPERRATGLPALRLAGLFALLCLLPAGGEGYSRFRVPLWILVALLAGAAVARRRTHE